MMQRLDAWARVLKRDVMTLWFALRHPGTPWYARLLAFVITAYALSPIDLIPDFIPVLGVLDDLILLPAGVWLFLKLVPPAVLSESRAAAEQWFAERRDRPRSLPGLILVLLVWLLAALAFAWWLGGAA